MLLPLLRRDHGANGQAEVGVRLNGDRSGWLNVVCN
jgi:hypothetical protein